MKTHCTMVSLSLFDRLLEWLVDALVSISRLALCDQLPVSGS